MKSLPIAALLTAGIIALTGTSFSSIENVSTKPSPEGQEIYSTDYFPLVEFQGNDEPDWAIVDDRVMGGISRSRMTIGEGVAIYRGNVTTESNGGFCSVRSDRFFFDIEEADGVALRVKGDGGTYAFTVRRSDVDDPRMSFRHEFPTKIGEWTEVKIPFETFEKWLWGRNLGQESPAYEGDVPISIGIMVTTTSSKTFRLEMDWIALYKQGEIASAFTNPVTLQDS